MQKKVQVKIWEDEQSNSYEEMREAQRAGMERQGQRVLISDWEAQTTVMQAFVDHAQVIGRVQVREDELCPWQWKKERNSLLINRRGLGMGESENVRNPEGTNLTPKVSGWRCEYQRLGSKRKITFADEDQILIFGVISLWRLWGMSNNLLCIGIWSLTLLEK